MPTNIHIRKKGNRLDTYSSEFHCDAGRNQLREAVKNANCDRHFNCELRRARRLVNIPRGNRPPFSYFQMFIQDSVSDDLGRVTESARHWIHGADVSREQVFQIGRFAPYFGVEIQSSWLDAILLKLWNPRYSPMNYSIDRQLKRKPVGQLGALLPCKLWYPSGIDPCPSRDPAIPCWRQSILKPPNFCLQHFFKFPPSHFINFIYILLRRSHDDVMFVGVTG